jgi:serralysin
MANNTYVIDALATNGQTISVTDDGTGSDWLVYVGIYDTPTEINLNWTFDGTNATSAEAQYYVDSVGSRLVVTGKIENAKGSNGMDIITGNASNNQLYGDNATMGPGGNDTILAGAGTDTVHGGAGADQISGEDGNDLLFGEAGADVIIAGAGIDTIEGGAGADTLTGDATSDSLSYAASASAVTIKITSGATTNGSGGDAQGDKISGFVDVIGSGFADVITDTVKTALAGGANDNVFSGGSGNDTLTMGGGNDSAAGGAGADVLKGEDGNDTLVGNDGADSLTGATGADKLTGNAGADRFIFLATGDSTSDSTTRDAITDFTHADGDKIDLSAIDANGSASGNGTFTLISGGFGGHAGELRLNAVSAGLQVQGDVNGDKVADFVVVVSGVTSLVATDFLL